MSTLAKEKPRHRKSIAETEQSSSGRSGDEWYYLTFAAEAGRNAIDRSDNTCFYLTLNATNRAKTEQEQQVH